MRVYVDRKAWLNRREGGTSEREEQRQKRAREFSAWLSQSQWSGRVKGSVERKAVLPGS
jgi:hypothetical protein